jgi:NADP-dependent 3-hydroxy acid dehydrogenase YdfG
MSSRHPERVWVITGASSGIGAAISRWAVRAGDAVVLAARSPDRLAACAQELDAPKRALAVAGDVTNWGDQQALVARTLAEFGRIDVLIANAGCECGGPFLGGCDTPDAWRTMVTTNVYGTALTVRAALPTVIQSAGHIVLMGSVAGRVAIPGELYSATKFAVAGMAESLRLQLVGTGVRVTLVQPGRVRTPLQPSELKAPMIDPDDVARAVGFALSQPLGVAVNEVVMRPAAQEL